MPAGTPYFAWIDQTETIFNAGHMRWDENIFSFKLSQEEGDPAALTVVVRRPRDGAGHPIGLLGPGRKIWCWFSLDCDGTHLIKFRGRLVGVPTDILQELVTLDFVARPVDIVAQKNALATTLAVLPFYDETLIDPARQRDASGNWPDPEVVLEGYTAIWYYNPETHVLQISDEITGEDGTVHFDASNAANKVLYDGLGFNLTTGPLTHVSLKAEFTWTNTSGGTVDLTSYILGAWPRIPPLHNPSQAGAIQLDESNWPKAGASLGSGWTVAASTAKNLFDFTIRTETFTNEIRTIFPDGDTVTGTINNSNSEIDPAPMIEVRKVTTNDVTTVATQVDPSGAIGGTIGTLQATFVSSFTRNTTEVDVRVGIQEIKPTLIATYGADRQMTERISIDLFADVQPILTDPQDGESLVISDIRSVNLSEPIGGTPPIGDQSRPSYITTARGNQAIEHCILLMRANLMKRARVVELTFAPKLERMAEITLRKSAFLVEPRVGQATGKIIGYSVALDGSDGKIKNEVRIGCTIGRGGTATASAGSPHYASTSYVGSTYQQMTGQMTAIGTSVTYSPPNYVPTPGSINFLSTLTAADVIEVPLSVQWGDAPAPATIPPQAITGTDALNTATEFVKAYWLPQFETQATFKLKSVTGDIATDYTIATSVLNVPTGYDLEAH